MVFPIHLSFILDLVFLLLTKFQFIAIGFFVHMLHFDFDFFRFF